MNRKHMFVATIGLVAVVAVAACKRETAASPADAVAGATTTDLQPTGADATPAPTASGTDATAVVDHSMETASGRDIQAFAGNFSAAGTQLALRADGSFALEQGAVRSEGTWTMEANGGRIRLDPDSKAEQDRLYAIASHDRIAPLRDDGRAAANRTDGSLEREAVAP